MVRERDKGETGVVFCEWRAQDMYCVVAACCGGEVSAEARQGAAEALFRALALKTSSSPRSFTFPCLTKPTTNTNLATKDNSLPIASYAAHRQHVHFE
jgi:hypothetical protein